MNDLWNLMPALMAGMVLGTIFFVGLWWTVRKGLSSTHPAPWFIGSLMLRTSIILAGFYIVSDGHWERLLVCLLGFSIVRPIVTLLTRSARHPIRLGRKESHAP